MNCLLDLFCIGGGLGWSCVGGVFFVADVCFFVLYFVVGSEVGILLIFISS